ncbi:bifunctional riboflavin kinase/FAD synthetase [Buchnera aphidicola (Neophyllaphis podocarpi)]|uniref:bifunctional riboflavin kinase/FAD synthetase n=1 Tax=Buchnera aphidicola TaxID=9 RepID=UPI0031B8A693
MKIIQNFKNIKKETKKSIIIIGNFDGVHLGHQKLILEAYKKKIKSNYSLIIIIFEPHPIEFFMKEKSIIRINSKKNKINHLYNLKVDKVICIKFDKNFSKIKPEKFITKILVKKFNIKYIYIGKDFRFGYKAQGNYLTLKEYGEIYNFNIKIIKNYYIQGLKVSSTIIRKALRENNFKLAKKLLGYNFYLSGKVIYGNKIGRKIGFPTANIEFKQNIFPIEGVFIVKVKILNNLKINGVANIGRKPTFKNKNYTLEVHFINKTYDVYGKYIQVIFYQKIRSEKMFDSIKNLKKQISKDIEIAKLYFSKNIKNKT